MKSLKGNSTFLSNRDPIVGIVIQEMTIQHYDKVFALLRIEPVTIG